MEVNQSRAHYTGVTICDDIPCRETIEEGQVMHFKAFADLASGPSHLKVELRVSSPPDAQPVLYMATEQSYPNAGNCVWMAHAHQGISSYKTLTISNRDPHAITGWYYMTVMVNANVPTTFTLRATLHVEDMQRGRQRGGVSNGSPGMSGTSHRNIHERVRLKIDEIAQNADARAALRKRILEYRKVHMAKQQLSGTGTRNIVEDNAGEIMALRNTPRAREVARSEWAAIHTERMSSAMETVTRFSEKLASQQDQVREVFDRRFRDSDRRRRNALRKRSQTQLQKKWMMWTMIGAVHFKWEQLFLSGRILREAFIRRTTAANVICQFIHRTVQKRRYRRARRSLLGVRTIIRLCVVNNQIVVRHRATDVFKQFLENAAGVQKNLSSIIKNFRHRVLVLQRFHSRWKLMRDAKIQLWLLQWDQIENRHRDDGVPIDIRTDLLRETMRELRLHLAKGKEAYDQELREYLKKKKMDDAKRMISDDGRKEAIKVPVAPKIPTLLPKKTIVALITEGRKRAADSHNLQEHKS